MPTTECVLAHKAGCIFRQPAGLNCLVNKYQNIVEVWDTFAEVWPMRHLLHASELTISSSIAVLLSNIALCPKNTLLAKPGTAHSLGVRPKNTLQRNVPDSIRLNVRNITLLYVMDLSYLHKFIWIASSTM